MIKNLAKIQKSSLKISNIMVSYDTRMTKTMMKKTQKRTVIVLKEDNL